jgi:hypothetical protein
MRCADRRATVGLEAHVEKTVDTVLALESYTPGTWGFLPPDVPRLKGIELRGAIHLTIRSIMYLLVV